MDAALVVDGLCKKYADFELQDVSFTVPKGSIMGFIGENGAGKSTTIKAILNLVKKDAGTVTVLGLDSDSNADEVRKIVGVVFDETYFHSNLTTTDISKFMKKIYKTWDDALYGNYLTRFALPNKKVVKDFSKGMKTKLSIAVALAHQPQILILDEATSGLDPVVRDEVLDIFYEFVQNKENAVLMSSHITTDLDKIADHITLIHQGKVVLSQNKKELLADTGFMRCQLADLDAIDKSFVAQYRKEPDASISLLITQREIFSQKYPQYSVSSANIEQIMLCTIKGEKA